MKISVKIQIVTLLVLMTTFSLTPSATAQGATGPDGKYTFSADWFSHNIPIWTRILGDMKGRANLAYLEIGTYEGRSFFWVLDNILTHPSSRAVGIDTFDKFGDTDPEEVFHQNLRRSGHSSKVKVIKGFSQQKLRDLKLHSFDLIYIDGDHSSRSVIMDAVLSWDLLKEGGIMIFDDYGWDFALPTEMRPTFAVDVFQVLFVDEFQLLFKDYQLILQKKVVPCDGARGSIKVGEIPLACTPLGPYVYYWKPRKLYNRADSTEIGLTKAEAGLIENTLLKRSLGFRLHVDQEELGQYQKLLDRLGITGVTVSPKAK